MSGLHLITVTYNSAPMLERFLDSLAAQSFTDWQLIAIDNASRDGSAAIVAGRPDARISLLRNRGNIGFAKAVNQGLRRASESGADFFLLLNSDTSFGPDFLADFIHARDTIGAEVIAPRIMSLNDPDKAWYAGGHLDNGWIFRNVHETDEPPDIRPSRRVDFASGCCLGLSRAAIEKTGLFDESFFVYWEDTDFCLRAARADLPIHYVRDPVIFHAGAASSGGENSPAHIGLYYRGYMQLLRRHFGTGCALRTMARVLAKESRRQRSRRLATCARMGFAMLRGVAARLVPVGRLEASGDADELAG